MLGTPVRDVAEPDDPIRTPCSLPELPGIATKERAPRNRWIWGFVATISALGVGIGAGSYLAHTPTPDPAPVAPTAPQAPVPASEVGSFAELVTSIHLSGLADPADLAPLYTGRSAPAGTTGLWANQTAAVTSTSLGEGFWQVTVAVDTLELVEGAYEWAGVQYYEVTVAELDGQPVAVSGPSRIPGPAAAPTPSGMPNYNAAVPADQTAAAISFLNAYLTGNGEIARFVSATARIAPFAEPPYASIEIRDLGTDSLGHVNVLIEATTDRGGHQALEYTLEMSFESGVWEVSNLLPAAQPAS